MVATGRRSIRRDRGEDRGVIVVATPEQSSASDPVRDTSNWIVLLFTIGISCLYLAPGLDKQWYPWDDGGLAQTAQRTLAGQLPHRDFVDTYTGGLSFFDAGVFWLFGTDLLWLRIAMIPFFILFVVATFEVARRLTPPLIAGLLTVTLVVWTVPNYSAAIPSWFNLYFAVAGVWMITKWLESNRDLWLFLAGFLGGLSIIVKIVGVYFVIGVILFLAFRVRRGDEGAAGTSGRETIRRGVVAALAVVSVVFVVWTMAPRLGWAEFVTFVVPVIAAAGAVIVTPGRGSRARDAAAIRAGGFFVAGVAVPIVLFAVPYLATGSWEGVIRDMTQSTQLRLTYAARPPLPPRWVIAVAPLAIAALFPLLRRGWRLAAMTAGLVALGVAALFARVDPFFMNPLRELLFLLAPAAAVVLVRAASRRPGDRRVELLALLLFVTVFMALIQFPFGAPIYFQYVLPLVVLTAVSFSSVTRSMWGPFGVAVVVIYLVVGVLYLQPGVRGLWRDATGGSGLAVPNVTRGRIFIPASEAATYRRVTSLLRAHARGGATIAGPDAPEIYFLADLRNPTPMIYDFLTRTSVRDRDILDAVAQDHITAIVVNHSPPFSPQYDPSLLSGLEEDFPHDVTVGQYDVRWRS